MPTGKMWRGGNELRRGVTLCVGSSYRGGGGELGEKGGWSYHQYEYLYVPGCGEANLQLMASS